MVVHFQDQVRLTTNLGFHVFHEKRIRPAPKVCKQHRKEPLIPPHQYEGLHEITGILPDHVVIVRRKNHVVKGKHIVGYGQMPGAP